MIRAIAIAAAFAAATAASVAVAQTTSAPWPGYAPQMFRWDEDYRFLRDRTGRAFFPYRLKYLPLGSRDDRYASFGGEYRFRVDEYQHPDFGLHAAPDFSSVQERFLLHADLHFNSSVRLFLQLGAATENGRKPFSRPSDKSRTDLAQGFLEVSLSASGLPWRVRLGRQEVSIGRYVAVRDGTNIRRTFDGARFDGTLGGWSLTGLAAKATRNLPGAFDDDPDPNDGIYLLMAEHALPWSGYRFDALAIERNNYLGHYASGIGVERRRSVGLRLFGAHRGWDVDGQISYQFGSFAPTIGAPLDIRAWGAAFEGGRSFATPWKPRLALRIDAAGGDNDPHDHYLGTFDLPYPNLSYLTDAALFAPRNVHDLQLFASVTPIGNLTLTAGAQFLWRNSRYDALYSAANFPLAPRGGSGLYVTTEPYLRINAHLTSLVELQGGIVHAMPGEVLRSLGATRRLDFAFASVSLRF